MGGLLSLIPGLGGVLEKVADKALSYIPDPEAREKAREEIYKMDLSSDAAQIQVNVEEAKSEQWWKAGWRPAVGWVCVAGLAWNYIIMPAFTNIVLLFNGTFVPSKLDITELLTLLFGMLGLSYHRSRDKELTGK